MRLEDRFEDGLDSRWDVAEIGGGSVRTAHGELRLTVPPTPNTRYSNAQITDYRFPGYNFVWRPPVRMTVIARASAPADQLRGTAGFGFWNHPFSPEIRRLPRLPQAIWFFFSSPPSDMRLAYGVQGPGWKAATIDATRPAALALAPLAIPNALLMRIPALYRQCWRVIQAALGVSEALLDGALLAQTHTYTLDWRKERAVFAVDGVTVLESPSAPRGPVGFVAWIDTQYAVATPQGKLGFGLVAVEREQSLVLNHVRIESG